VKLQKILITCLLIWSGAFGQTTIQGSENSFAGENFIIAEVSKINSIGEFKENWKEGNGFYAGYGWIYSDGGSLYLQTGYISFDPNENAEYVGSASFNVIPFIVGGRYYFSVDRFRPYLLGSSGINLIQQDWATADTSVSSTGYHLGFQTGAGIDVLLFNNLQIELAFKYNSHLLQPPDPYNITGMEYSVGILWRLE